MVAGPMTPIAALVDRLEPDLIALRRDIHRHPDLGFAEHRTADLVVAAMRSLGVVVRSEIGGTGILADLVGDAPGPVLLVRAELDALPVSESTGREFASTSPGRMHACGHDAHIAAVVGTATVLSELRAGIAGTVRFCFQPAEELLAGAERMIAGGAMDGVDLVLGAHVLSSVPLGEVVLVPGPFLAGADFFELTVIGRGGHGGMPHLSVDPVYAAAQVVVGLQSIVARETKPGTPIVVSINAVQGGSAPNVVADDIVLRGNVRWFADADRDRVLERIPQIARAVCEAIRADVRFEITASAPVTVNSRSIVEAVADVARTSGVAPVDLGPLTASDDFAQYLASAPGALIGVGAGFAGAAPHHHGAFDIDERAIGVMTQLLARTALRVLSSSAAFTVGAVG